MWLQLAHETPDHAIFAVWNQEPEKGTATNGGSLSDPPLILGL